jgi:hypothetical protein
MTVGRIPNVEGGIQPTLLTTTGDIIYASSASNPARLGIGSSAQVLTVAAGIPSWATPSSGGMTLLSTTTLSGATTTISISDQTYVNLFCIISGVTNATGNGTFRIAPNGTTGITTQQLIQAGIVTSQINNYLFLTDPGDTIGSGNSDNIFTLTINNYASTTKYKTHNTLIGYNDPGNSQKGGGALGYIRTTSAISSLVFSNTGGNLSTGTVLIYGVK